MNLLRALPGRRMSDRIPTPGLTISAIAVACGVLFIILSGGQAGAFGGGAANPSAASSLARHVASATQSASVVPVRRQAYRYPDQPVPSLFQRPVNGPSYGLARIHDGASVPLR